MRLRALLADDDAVSPVISVILVVAITVILGTVAGALIFDFGDQLSETEPDPVVRINDSNVFSTDTAVGVTHQGGDELDQSTLEIAIGGTAYWSEGTGSNLNGNVKILEGDWNASAIRATDTMVFWESGGVERFGNGDEVVLIWTAEDGTTAILTEKVVG